MEYLIKLYKETKNLKFVCSMRLGYVFDNETSDDLVLFLENISILLVIIHLTYCIIIS